MTMFYLVGQRQLVIEWRKIIINIEYPNETTVSGMIVLFDKWTAINLWMKQLTKEPEECPMNNG